MKSSRAEIHRGVHAIPDIRFDDQKMTSFAGLVVFQHLFRNLDLKRQLKRVFGDADRKRSFGLGVVALQLVVHVLIGFRRIRDRDYYATDPLVCRVIGVAKLPDVATISRTLSAATAREVLRLRALLRRLVLDRMRKLGLATVTLDFDGSVLSTRGHAEGSAIGYNKKRKGSRSYYPLFCTVSQTGQFLDILHRPGNVHDSRDSAPFINEMIAETRATLPQARIEARFDAAFFSEKTLNLLEEGRIEYSISVPFERFPGLRARILRRTSGWRRIDDEHAFIEVDWKPKSWSKSAHRRIIVIRTRRAQRIKGPLQLDIFEPRDHEFEYKAIVTNKAVTGATAMRFHNGRGNQEGVLGEGKHWAALDYVPCRRLVANQIYSCCAMLAHNLARELQMATGTARSSRSVPTRAAAFAFAQLGTLRELVLRRAGSITRPAGRYTITIAADGAAQDCITRHVGALRRAA